MSIRSSPKPSLVAYPTKGKLSAFPVPSANQVNVYNARSFNNSGGVQNVGILQLFINAQTRIWQFVNVGPVYTDLTPALNTGTASVIFSGANNDGFYAQANSQFGMLGLTISTAAAGGTFVYKYWNGTSLVTLPTLEVPVDYSATGDTWIVFQPPTDWVKGGPAQLNQNQYTIFVQSTTAPAGPVSANFRWLAGVLELVENVPNNAYVQLSFPDSKPFLLEGGQGLIPYFSTPNASNQFGAYYSLV